MKLIKILQAITVLCLLASCEKGGANYQGGGTDGGLCGDLSQFPSSFDISDISLDTLVELDESPFLSLSGDPYTVGSAVEFDQLILSFVSAVEYAVLENQIKRRFNLSLFESAVACSPASPRSVEKIIRFDITSSNSFSDDFVKGSILNSLFDVVYADPYTRYDRYVDGKKMFFTLEEYIAQDTVSASELIQLKLNREPQYSGPQKFYISITLDSGDQFEIETPEITF